MIFARLYKSACIFDAVNSSLRETEYICFFLIDTGNVSVDYIINLIYINVIFFLSEPVLFPYYSHIMFCKKY